MLALTPPPVNGPGRTASITTLITALVAAALLLIVAGRALTLPPTFDGAMNLQVAWSLAEGNGYARSYAEQSPFPREVQTNGPYVMTAALTYLAFGMGIVQSQLPNLVFMVLLAAAAFWLGRTMRGRASDGFLAVAMFLATPGLLKFGLRGYGEIPGLALVLTGLAVYPWSSSGPRLRVAAAALLLGTAVTTKTVMLVCVAAVGLVMFLHAVSRPVPPASRARATALLIVGFLVPILAWEAYRMASLGGPADYRAGWALEFTSITREAGVDAAAARPQFFDKVTHHFQLLAGFLRLPLPLVAAWLVLPFLLAAFIPRTGSHARWIVAAVLAAAAAYFAWWLGLTPTEKAWHRRIFNGIILINIAWILVAGACAGARVAGSIRGAGIAATAVAACFGTAFLVQSRLHDALHPVDTSQIQRAVEVLHQLPPDARLYAAGWSSAPQISLLADRPLLDVPDAPFDALVAGAPTYLVIDQEGGYTASTDRILDMYPSTPLLPGDVLPQIYRFDATRLAALPTPSDLSQPVGLNALADDQAKGFHKMERDGRWASADGAVRTIYGGEETLALEVYILANERYAGGHAPRISVELNDCELPKVDPGPGLPALELPVAPCAPEVGEPMTIRIQSNTLVESSITVDERAMAFIARTIQLPNPDP